MKRLITVLLLLALPMAGGAAGRKAGARIVATERGIVGDGITMNTAAIQAAIDQLSASGGGCLTFPAGTYLTGNIFLKDHVQLHLEGGATLLGSADPDDYVTLDLADDDRVLRKDSSRMALVFAVGAKDVRLTGHGTIDGQGRALALAVDSLCLVGAREDPGYASFLQRIRENPLARRGEGRPRPRETLRPKLLFFTDCEGVSVEDLHFRSSAAWGLSFNNCDKVEIRSVDILNRAYWNNDGIDLTDCRDVTVTGCRIDSADDGICLKSDLPERGCERILVEDCDLVTSASAVKFGTASWGGFRDVTVRRIRVRDTFRSAIAIETVDGGTVENILVEEIQARNTGNAVFIRLGHRAGEHPGTLRNVVIRRVSCSIPFGRPDEAYDVRGPIDNSVHNVYASSVTGLPGARVENVTLEDIDLVCPGRASKAMGYIPLSQLQLVPEQADAYPEFSMFGETPSWAFYVRHVDGITFRRIRLTLREEDFRPAFVFDDVTGISLEEISFPPLGGKPEVFTAPPTE